MSVIEIPQGERGVVRVFSLSMDAREAKALRDTAAAGDGPGPLEAALGVSGIDPEFVTVFALSDIREIGLGRYLEDGHGVEPAQLEPDRRKLAALDGWVMLVHSAAFGGRGATLRTAPELTHVGTYSEPGVDWSEKTRLTSGATRGTAPPAKKAPSEAAVSGRVALIALLVLFALTAVVIWIAA